MRYSRVSRRIWGDESFRELSSIQPSGQGLFLRLITAPEARCIPGLVPVWEAGLAQSLGWALGEFQSAFKEIEAKGMVKADWSAGLVWLPNAIQHDRPQSPNVIKSWAKEWTELPECELKNEAFHVLRAFTEGLGEAFAKAFREAFPEYCRKPSGRYAPTLPESLPGGMPPPFREVCPHPSPIQQQEQQQEQQVGSRTPAHAVKATCCPADLRLSDEAATQLEIGMGITPEHIRAVTATYVVKKRASNVQKPYTYWHHGLVEEIKNTWTDPVKRKTFQNADKPKAGPEGDLTWE